MTREQIVAAMKSRFTSTNSVPVERAHIRREEWDVILAELTSYEDEVTVRRNADIESEWRSKS